MVVRCRRWIPAIPLLVLFLAAACEGDDGTKPVDEVPVCRITPSALAFDSVAVDSTKDLLFTIKNTGTGTLTGSVTESCPAYSIQSGAGSYSLAANQERTVTVRFEPTATGAQSCTVNLGAAACGSVVCSGTGTEPPPTTGSCCATDNTCTVTTPAACVSPDGWQGAGTSCLPNPCTQPTGACCAPAGTCTVTTPLACIYPSMWQGAGASCSPNPCTQPTGACCAPAGTCTVTTPLACIYPSRWQGAATSCSPNPCTQPRRACCTPAGTCTVTTQAECLSPSTWRGADTSCSPNPCPQPTGACCAPASTCTVTTQTACVSPSTWQGAGISCSPNRCTQPWGACCAPAGTCTVTTQAACVAPTTWLGAGTRCSPNPCPAPPSMVLVPAGTFTMGFPTDEPVRGASDFPHQVTLTKAIYVSTYEVTQAEWLTVISWNQSRFQGAGRPVEQVNWYDAVSYCNQRSLSEGYTPAYTITGATISGNHIANATVTWNQAADGYRLLTEAEWEYACRATSTTAFCNGPITNSGHDCGDDPGLDLVGWYCGNALNTTHDCGYKTANAWGLKDMHGNVWEWCWDWRGSYSGDATDPTGPPSGSYRVLRGGGFSDFARNCRSAIRYSDRPNYGCGGIGLRVARTSQDRWPGVHGFPALPD